MLLIFLMETELGKIFTWKPFNTPPLHKEVEIKAPKFEQGISLPHPCSCLRSSNPPRRVMSHGKFSREMISNYKGFLSRCCILFRVELSFDGVGILKLESNIYQDPLLVKNNLIFIINFNTNKEPICIQENDIIGWERIDQPDKRNQFLLH